MFWRHPYLFRAAWIIGLFLANIASSHASCARAWTGSSTRPSLNFGNLTAAASDPNGTVLATASVDIDDASCAVPSSGSTIFDYKMLGTLSALPNVYTTNVGGVGVRVTPASTQGNTNYAPFTTTIPAGTPSPYIFKQRMLLVELIKIGTIQTGVALSGVFYQGTARDPGFGSDVTFVGGTFKTISCSTQDVNVSLPTLYASDLASTVVAGTTSFSINISCPGAATDALTSISYQFKNLSAILDAPNGVIALDSSSTASGVGIKILDTQNNPLKFQYAYALSPSPAQTQYQIPLKAAYYKTGTVNPGSVKGLIQFTLTYQ